MAALWLVFLIPFAYQILAIAACWKHLARTRLKTTFQPPVSILKPVRGLDPGMLNALRSQVEQQYPEFEILFGVSDPDDPAVSVIDELRRAYPQASIELHVGADAAQNGKVGVLSNLAKHARHAIWIVNDSDISVTHDYLARVVAPLHDPRIGLVTCLYRPQSHSRASSWEALGIAIDFMPSTLVAPLVGVREFGLGSTLCFRSEDLIAGGGFEAIKDYIADDYQLARRIVASGKCAYLSDYVVETSLGDPSWSAVWQHQLRWARTIKASKGLGFAGLPTTHTGIWILGALVAHLWPAALLLAGIRVSAALLSGWLVIGLKRNPVWALLAPVWDLYAFAVWGCSYASDKVQWRDKRLRIKPDGQLEQL